MIFNDRRRSFPCPATLTDADGQWENIARTGNTELIKPSIYKGEKMVRGIKRAYVRETLKSIYHNKCAYCEKIEHKPEVEHYRPKKRIAEDSNHSGYYWLCYEWTNLLPSCRYCNTEGGKGNKFPILGSRVSGPSFINGGGLDKDACKLDSPSLLAEQPFLLHPEIDNPKNFLAFKNNGEIYGIDRAGRGQKTVDICNLCRQNLLSERQSIIDEIVDRIDDTLFLFKNKDLNAQGVRFALFKIFGRLKEKDAPHKRFSHLAWYAFQNFGQIVIPLVAKSLVAPERSAYQNIVKLAFRSFLAENQ